MKFNITQTFPTVESYLSQFLKVSKKNIHTIRMNNHHNKETIKINSDLPGISNVSKTINDLFVYSKQLNRSIRIISYKTRTHSLSSSSSDTFSSLESDYDSDDK